MGALMLAASLAVAQAPATAPATGWLDAVNRERARCGAPPVAVDPRLQAVAAARFRQLPACGYSHVGPGGTEPVPPLLAACGFPDLGGLGVSYSEGIVVGGASPSGLYDGAEGPYRPGVVSHHNDLVNPRWNRVGFAAGRTTGPNGGVTASVIVYGYDPPAGLKLRPRARR